MKIGTYNINYSRRAQDGFSAFHWNSRKTHVYELMNKVSAEIWCVQEIHQDYTDEFCDTMNQFHWFYSPENSRGGKLTHLAIGITKKFNVEDLEFSNYNFNQYHEIAENVVCCHIKSLDLVVVCVHFPMD